MGQSFPFFDPLREQLEIIGHEVTLVDAGEESDVHFYCGLARKGDGDPLIASARIADALLSQQHDLCIFPSREGLAHGTVMARACGELPRETKIALWKQTPLQDWFGTKGWYETGLRPVVAAALQKIALEHADFVLSSEGRPTDVAELNDNFVASGIVLDGPALAVDHQEPIREIVFVGPLSRASGFVSFIEVMESFAQTGLLADKVVSFIGFFGETSTGVNREWLGRRARSWTFRFQIIETNSLTNALRNAVGAGKMTFLSDIVGYGARRISTLATHQDSLTILPGETIWNTALFREAIAAKLIGANPDSRGYPGRVDAKLDIDSVITRSSPGKGPTNTGVGLSICILHFERPRLLAQALASVSSQLSSGVPIEIVIVDNASKSAESLAMLDAVQRQHATTLLRLEQCLPYSSALNIAAARARFPFLVFLDDDNLLAPGGLSRISAACALDLFDVIVSNLDVFDGPDSDGVSRGRLVFIGQASTAGLFFNAFGDTSMAFRRESFLKIGGFLECEAAYASADWITLARVQAAGLRIGVIQQPAFRYRADSYKSNVHWQPYDQHSVRAMLVDHFGGCYDAKLLARCAQSMFLDLVG